MTPTELVLSKLDGAKKNGKGWQARCPAHADKNPSLSVSEGDDGRALVRCHAGCEAADVAGAIGLTLADLMPPSESRGDKPRVVAVYHYRDAGGEPLYDVLRYRPKAFKQRAADGGWSLKGIPRVLYRLPELIAADPSEWVFVCEGEKDCDALASVGKVATCNAGGAGKFGTIADTEALRGRCVCIWRDADEPGRKHAADVHKRLTGIAAELRCIEHPKFKDASDYLADARLRELDAEGIENELWRGLTEWAVEPEAPEAEAGPVSGPVIVNLGTVKPRPIEWLWRKRIALGKPTMIAGDPGLGKSLCTLDLIARVTTGRPWPDGGMAPMGGAVLMTAEDDIEDTVLPRLLAAGGRPEHVNVLQGISSMDDSGRRVLPVTLDNLAAIEAAIAATDNCRLCVIDPISAYMGGTDSHVNAAVRGILAPLGDLAARHGVALVAVTHLRKGEGAAVYRAMGSLAFVAAARAAWAVTADKDDPEGPRRLFLPIKNNIGPRNEGLAYSVRLADDEMPRIEWEADPVRISADDALAAKHGKRGPEPEARTEAVEFLRSVLADGPMKAKDVQDNARDCAIGWRTMQRAKRELGIVAVREGGTGPAGWWVWSLPDTGGSA